MSTYDTKNILAFLFFKKKTRNYMFLTIMDLLPRVNLGYFNVKFLGVAWWYNGRAPDYSDQEVAGSSTVGAQLRNDSGKVTHTLLPRHRQSVFVSIWSR